MGACAPQMAVKSGDASCARLEQVGGLVCWSRELGRGARRGERERMERTKDCKTVLALYYVCAMWPRRVRRLSRVRGRSRV